MELVRVDQITDNTVTDFDLFLKLADHVVLYSGNGYHWYRRELSDLLTKGFNPLWMRKEDAHLFDMYKKLVGLPSIEKSLAPKERINNIQDVGRDFTKCLYDGSITRSCVEKAKTIGDALVECLVEDRTCIKHLSGLGDYDYYTYYHSVRVASYAVAIAIQMGLRDEDMLRQIALGGVLHDIGKKDVPLEIINKVGVLTEDEWQKMRSHPQLGSNLLEKGMPFHVPKEIVLHHHEKLDGSGYPDALSKSSLIMEVQIATLADVYDALTSTRSYQMKRSRYEALDFIRHNLVPAKISREPFQALVRCLNDQKKAA